MQIIILVSEALNMRSFETFNNSNTSFFDRSYA